MTFRPTPAGGASQPSRKHYFRYVTEAKHCTAVYVPCRRLCWPLAFASIVVLPGAGVLERCCWAFIRTACACTLTHAAVHTPVAARRACRKCACLGSGPAFRIRRRPCLRRSTRLDHNPSVEQLRRFQRSWLRPDESSDWATGPQLRRHRGDRRHLHLQLRACFTNTVFADRIGILPFQTTCRVWTTGIIMCHSFVSIHV